MKLHLIQFSAQISGGDANRIFGAYHKMLNRIFYVSEYNKKTTGIYFHNLWYFSIIFRVARGEINFDNGQGLKFLKRFAMSLAIPLIIPYHKFGGRVKAIKNYAHLLPMAFQNVLNYSKSEP